MDFYKLKLEKFKTYDVLHCNELLDVPLTKDENPEVYFSFCSSVQDVMSTINIVQNKQKHKENRVFFVFKKGNKGFNRDHIYNVVIRNSGFKRKAPILASLNKEYSVFSFMFTV